MARRVTNPFLRAASPAGLPGAFGLTRKMFDDIENFIADNAASQERMEAGIDLLIRGMALATKGLAQQKSMGPVSPTRRSVPALANRIPVQRITGTFAGGWRQRRIGPAKWATYNDSPEAYLIETGLYMRVRRPILKLSVIGMMKFLQTTRTAERFMDHVLAPRRNAHGRFQPFNARIAGSSVLGGMAGPRGRLP